MENFDECYTEIYVNLSKCRGSSIEQINKKTKNIKMMTYITHQWLSSDTFSYSKSFFFLLFRGMTAYYLEFLKLRIMIHARNAQVSTEVVNVNTLEQTGVIRIHWRLTGVSQARVLKFWRLFTNKEEDIEWVVWGVWSSNFY